MYSSASSPAAARRELEQSLRLFTDLGDDEGIAEVGSLLRQTDTGLQAETFMSQAQAALELHDYDRAQTLLNVSLVAPRSVAKPGLAPLAPCLARRISRYSVVHL